MTLDASTACSSFKEYQQGDERTRVEVNRYGFGKLASTWMQFMILLDFILIFKENVWINLNYENDSSFEKLTLSILMDSSKTWKHIVRKTDFSAVILTIYIIRLHTYEQGTNHQNDSI